MASHASWMENFPWTRLPGRELPDEQKPFVPFERLRDRNAEGVRDLIGDGNYGGVYKRHDGDTDRIWAIAVEETRALLEGEPHGWDEPSWRELMGQVRAGRNLLPKSWPGGARCAVLRQRP